jgi:voltage-gated chloride channel/trypsin-like peptidase
VTPRERLTLIAAGAGAGLAAAFNAPLAGLAFVLEELQRDFTPLVFGASFIAAVTADVVTRSLTDQLPIFHVVTYPVPPLVALPWFLLLGLLTGVLGVAFNFSVSAAMVGVCLTVIGLIRQSGFLIPASIVVLLLVTLLTSRAHVREAVAAKRPKLARCAKPIPDIFESVSPAVVFIAATSINPYHLSDRGTHIVASDFIFDASGLILTNSHVALGRQSIVVTLGDGTSLAAQLVRADSIFDLAVLRIPLSARLGQKGEPSTIELALASLS